MRLGYRLLAIRDVAAGDLVDEGRIGVEEHDVEVLHGADGLDARPVPEPQNLQPGGNLISKEMRYEYTTWSS